MTKKLSFLRLGLGLGKLYCKLYPNLLQWYGIEQQVLAHIFNFSKKIFTKHEIKVLSMRFHFHGAQKSIEQITRDVIPRSGNRPKPGPHTHFKTHLS